MVVAVGPFRTTVEVGPGGSSSPLTYFKTTAEGREMLCEQFGGLNVHWRLATSSLVTLGPLQLRK